MARKVDFLVVGSGIAGLSYALKVAEHGSVCVISKTQIQETNTRYAQGGIAAVVEKPDSYKKHFEDTMSCGSGLNNESIVRMVVKEGPKMVHDLMNWGTQFDKKPSGHFDLAREGGHSEKRVLHHKDNTGFEIQRALTEKVLNHPNITVIPHCFAVDLITQHHLGKQIKRQDSNIECYGVYTLDLNNNKIETILTKNTMIATGGIGNLYLSTTNPLISTGDGIALVYRAKGIIENMEFVQFHPTAFYNPIERPSFLITEALRGFGAILKTTDGKPFMHKYDDRESLAPRDIVARAIDTELKMRGDYFVHLDCRHLDSDELKSKFPNIYEECLKRRIDITKECIPVAPAAHYLCGGIKIDNNGQTSIKNLYAAGEVSSSGLHGANRLASNSLLEAVVFSDKAAKASIQNLSQSKFVEKIPDWNDDGTTLPEEMVLITQSQKEVQQIMTNYVGIVRSNLRLKRALTRLEILYLETEVLYKKSKLSLRLCELRNLINVGYLVIKMAKERKESKGLHYNIDFPPEINL
ncbi:MAG: L-aspartate oxidase [Marinilabiliales bacterium]|nr:MAG: L-aspartate oxidase [Marinilabiliales bacterium]